MDSARIRDRVDRYRPPRIRGRLGDWTSRESHRLCTPFQALGHVAAKGLIAAFYGRPAAAAYLNSCSNGGRQALMEVQRYPNDFDGVVAGAPWNYQSRSNAGFVWDAQTLAAPGAAIPASKLPAIHAAAIAACDAHDGLADSLIENPGKCAFDPSTLLCKSAESDACLTQKQVESLKRLYSGPRNPRTGERCFPGWARGSAGVGAIGRGHGRHERRPTRAHLLRLPGLPKSELGLPTFDFDSHMALRNRRSGSWRTLRVPTCRRREAAA